MKSRVAGIDILKVIASFCVIALHTQVRYFVMPYILNKDVSTFLFLLLRYVVMSCVPVFILITGYLQANKKFSKIYYLKLLPILATYYIIVIFGEFVQRVYGVFTGTVWESVLRVLDFSSNTYSWYVEMFIGLYLIIPLLNNALKALTMVQQRWAIGILFFCTILPTLPQTFEFPFILPDYWGIAYPICYYFIGAYVRQHQPRINKWVLSLSLLFWLMVPIVLQYTIAPDGNYSGNIMNGFNAVSTCMVAVTMLLLFYSADIPFKPIKKVFTKVASASLGIYLISFYIEFWVYNNITAETALSFIPLGVQQGLAIFTGATFFAIILDTIIGFATKLITSTSKSEADTLTSGM